jgi:HPt (histidine-containing phosphotransfer) domain-containing protein
MLLLERDPSALRRLLDLGGPDLVRRMIDLFVQHTPGRIVTAAQGERSGDWTAVERAGHSMKSSAAYLGLIGLQERAARLEDLAARGGSREVRDLVQELSQGFPALRTLLQDVDPARG